MKQSVYDHFGIRKTGLFVNEQFTLNSKDIKSAILNNDMIAIVGKYGAGKTKLFNAAKMSLSKDSDKSPYFVHVRSKDKQKLRIGHIVSAIIMDISSEDVRRDSEARARQLIRLAGVLHVKHGRHICVIIDDAHMIHSNTLSALKSLREDDFNGVCPLFSIVLVGQEPLYGKLDVKKEVFWRTNMISLNESSGWFTYEDRRKYINHIYGDAISRVACERIAALWKLPLEINYHVDLRLEEAFKAGLTKLSDEAFEVSIQETLNALNAGISTSDKDYISLSKIADEAGIGKTTASDVIRGHNINKKEAVQDALKRLSQKKQARKVA